MTTAELRAARPIRLRGGIQALEAQRLIDLIALRLAPSAAAGLIAYSHMTEVGTGLIVFLGVLLATHALDRAEMPMQLMPASRVIVGALAPVVGALIAWLVLLRRRPRLLADAVRGRRRRLLARPCARRVDAPARDAQPDGPGRGYRRARVRCRLRRRADRVRGDRSYEVVGWVGATGPAEYRRLRWLGPLDQVRDAVIGEGIDLLVLAPSAGDPAGSRIEDVFGLVADECLDLPVRLIAANQLYEELFGHVPVGTIDAAWYRYIMHPRYRAGAPLSKRIFDLSLCGLIALLFAPLMLIAAIAIKLSDERPDPLSPAASGEFGAQFSILKLRTMRSTPSATAPGGQRPATSG